MIGLLIAVPHVNQEQFACRSKKDWLHPFLFSNIPHGPPSIFLAPGTPRNSTYRIAPPEAVIGLSDAHF
jgi:hypothetical protein